MRFGGGAALRLSPFRRLRRLGHRRLDCRGGCLGRRLGRSLRLVGRLLGRRRGLAGAPARAAASATGPAAAHRAETLAVRTAAALALAETLGGATGTAAAASLVLVAEAQLAASGHALEALGHDLALVDPDLDADPAEGRLRLGEAVVDVGADRVQRHAALRVHLRAAHLAAAEPAAADHLDAVGAGADRRGERALHRTPEADAVLELLRDRLGDQLRVELGPLDLVDVDVHGLVRHAVDLLAERVDLDAGLADHDPRPRRVDVDRDPLSVLPDQDVRQARVRELVLDVLADLDVLEQVGRELLRARVPVGLPVVDDADAHPAGMDLLTH